MHYKELLQSKVPKKILYGIGIAVIALVIFQAGVFVGYHKAAFSYRWGDNYYRTFGEPQKRFGREFPRGGFSDAHGATGKIIKIDLPTFVVQGQDNIEKIVVIKNDTAIRRSRNAAQQTDLKIDDFVVVIGSPNDQGQIEAKLIRLMPPPPEFKKQNGETQ